MGFVARALDSVIAEVAPRAAARRMAARQGMQGLRTFHAAAHTARTKHWRATNASHALETQAGLPTLRARARDMSQNNPWAGRAVRRLTTGTIGASGIRLALRTDSRRGNAAEDIWKAWAGTTACDADGRTNLSGLQRIVMRTVADAGEVLVRRRVRRMSDGLPVPMQLQVLEVDHLDTFRDQELIGGGAIIQGVEYDSLGRRVAYHLFRHHPGDVLGRFGVTSVRVAASEILHVYRTDRPGQVRGVPWGASCLLRLRDLDLFEDAELRRRQVAALFAGFIHGDPDDAPLVAQGDEGSSEAGLDVESMEPGTLTYLEPGEDITFGQPPAVEGFEEYVKLSLKGVGAGYDVPYILLAGDFSDVNFTSGRLGLLDWLEGLEGWRNDGFIPQFCDPVLRWFLAFGDLAGAVPGGGSGLELEWTPPRIPIVDPSVETKAATAQVRAGFRSWSDVVRSYGRDPRRVLDELAEEQQTFDRLGLVLDSDGRVPATGNRPDTAAKPGADGGESEGEEQEDSEES